MMGGILLATLLWASVAPSLHGMSSLVCTSH
jgi:hypothetical protein